MNLARANVFDILGPIMVGPSSSHTAGAVRLGIMARKILGVEPDKAEIRLHGSFAETGKGHGTNLAFAAGLMGMGTDDERIPQALALAKEKGLDIQFTSADLGDVHPNTAEFHLRAQDGRSAVVLGSSIGGGQIKIVAINGFPVEISGDYPTLVILHRDLPGVVAQVTSLLATAQVNIAQMRVSREKRGAQALTIVETDQPLDSSVMLLLRKLPAVVQAIAVELG